MSQWKLSAGPRLGGPDWFGAAGQAATSRQCTCLPSLNRSRRRPAGGPNFLTSCNRPGCEVLAVHLTALAFLSTRAWQLWAACCHQVLVELPVPGLLGGIWLMTGAFRPTNASGDILCEGPSCGQLLQ